MLVQLIMEVVIISVFLELEITRVIVPPSVAFFQMGRVAQVSSSTDSITCLNINVSFYMLYTILFGLVHIPNLNSCSLLWYRNGSVYSFLHD